MHHTKMWQRLGRVRQYLVASAVGLALLATPSFGGSDHFKNSDAIAIRMPGFAARTPTPEEIKTKAATQAEYQRELKVMHITKMREPRNGIDPDAPNAANYDEALASPYPRPSDVLRMNNGEETPTADAWWKVRRPEIVAAFERDIYGRLPKVIPAVNWSVVNTKNETIGGYEAVTQRMAGEVDNSGYRAIKVTIDMALTLPANAKGRVPVIMVFGAVEPKPSRFANVPSVASPPGYDWKAQLLSLGWGYVVVDQNSVQADNGAGLDKGIIGLVNKGKPRKMDDWGALRAWAWGAGRALDAISTNPHVAADQVGIAGHSRTGKAALVTLAFDQRFAIGYISSSGGGGAKLMRRYYGETVENVASDEQFHWVAGNYLKYAADPLTANDLPVDGDALISLCAPRPIFISGGAAAAGDAWVDAKGMFMGAAGAGPAYRLLSKKDMGTTTFPQMGTALLDGDIGFRQHQYGHTMTPNWPTFLAFAEKYLKIQNR